jgi:hypothetical protein
VRRSTFNDAQVLSMGAVSAMEKTVVDQKSAVDEKCIDDG